MPHLIYEYSDNLADENIQTLLQQSSQVLINQGGLHFSAVFEQRGLALSLEYDEFSYATWKKNNLHARYRKN